MDRRAFIIGTAAATTAGALALWRRRHRPVERSPHGPLQPDPRGLLDLPRGFAYSVVQHRGDRMSDGFAVPAAAAGMGCFAGPGGSLVLMRNHDNLRDPKSGAYPLMPPPPLGQVYDPGAFGAVTRVVLDPGSLTPRSSNLVLTGSLRNTGGGPSPWGWLSCEASTEPRHGYVFLCPTEASSARPPRALLGYGRFRHASAAVVPGTMIAYLTEDQADGCLYRFVPHRPSSPFEGQLMAMRIAGGKRSLLDRFDTAAAARVGERMAIDWVPVDGGQAATDEVRHRAHFAGAAMVRRGTGLWLDGQRLYFLSTSGGPSFRGQVFMLELGETSSDSLVLLAQADEEAVLDMPQTLAESPWGDLVLVEDGPSSEQHLRLMSAQRRVSRLARHPRRGSAFGGACFSPSGDTLFVNLRDEGLTLAVRGPWQRG